MKNLALKRFYALDIFRGGTVAFMILVNNAGNWDFIYKPLEHAQWNGWTPTDLVFPFFLFAVGNALAFSEDKFKNKPQNYFWFTTLKRFLSIFLIGLFLNSLSLFRWENDQLIFRSFDNLRIFGVLQRIAICYLLAAILIHYLQDIKKILYCAVGILIGYWFIVANSGSLDPFSLNGFIGTRLDLFLFGPDHLYHGEGVPFDPEGLFSNISATVNVLLGYFIGYHLKHHFNQQNTLTKLLLFSGICLWLGFLTDYIFPINKKIWSSSYVLLTVGLAGILLLLLVYLFDIKNLSKKYGQFFNYYGLNPLFIYFLSGFIPRISNLIRWQSGFDPLTQLPIYVTPLSWYSNLLQSMLTEHLKFASFLYAFSLVIFFYLIARWLYKKSIFIKV